MPSPFPGMDPYIEACGLWGDFHDRLIGELERALAAALPLEPPLSPEATRFLSTTMNGNQDAFHD